MWYHNGAWRIGSYTWLANEDLGRCHAFVKTSGDLGEGAETWMSCRGGADPDLDLGLFVPQMSARAAKMALDNVVKRQQSRWAPEIAAGKCKKVARNSHNATVHGRFSTAMMPRC